MRETMPISGRWSDAASAFIGLAWVPTEMAADGTHLDFRSNGARVDARVHLKPFYDPDGARLLLLIGGSLMLKRRRAGASAAALSPFTREAMVARNCLACSSQR